MIVIDCKIGTPLERRVPKVRVILAILTLRTRSPTFGVLIDSQLNNFEPTGVFIKNFNPTNPANSKISVRTIFSRMKLLIPTTSWVGPGKAAPSSISSKIVWNFGTTTTISRATIETATPTTTTG